MSHSDHSPELNRRPEEPEKLQARPTERAGEISREAAENSPTLESLSSGSLSSDSLTQEFSPDDIGDGYYDDDYFQEEPVKSQASEQEQAVESARSTTVAATSAAVMDGGGNQPPGGPPDRPGGSNGGGGGEEEDEEEEMLRMSFMEHLEELRMRILYSLAGLGVAFLVSLIFANQLWEIISRPAAQALTELGFEPKLAQIRPLEVFQIVWIKLPMLTAIFLASPWILYQAWAFIAPGLYKRERRWAAPFVIISAGLFILGGLFAYFVAFRFGLTFLLGIGRDINIMPVVSVSEYFDLFVNVVLGIGVIFELPVLIFLLTLLRVISPRFLLRHTRYAILIIVTIAAIITPTPDVFNLMLFSVPMILLYFLGVLGSYLIELHREGRSFPWRRVVFGASLVLAVGLSILGYSLFHMGYKLTASWPFLTR